MNKMMLHYIGIVCMLMYNMTFPQDAPDGFASVSSKGLTTTTGGAGGETVTVTTFTDLKKYAESSDRYIILVKDTIRAPNKGDGVNVTSDKTIVGLGDNGTLYQIELHCINRQNIIIRNLIICDSYVEGNYECKDTDWDGIQADSCHHLWIDHCHLTHNCDGLIDLRKSCDYVTVSWVHLSNHNKTFGVGWTTNTEFRQTIHHCWFDNTNQRNPSFDMGMGHLYNNYLFKTASYGNLARGDARVVIENSYYEQCKDPIKISDNAKCYVSNIYATGCSGISPEGNVSSMPFKPGDSYKYTLDPADQVKRIVSTGAGPEASIGEQYLETPPPIDLNGYDMIVAKDGSGTHTTVQSAFNDVEKNRTERTVIYIKSGTYKENLTLESDHKNVTVIGEDRKRVTLTYDNYASKVNPATGSTYGTSGSSSFFLNGEGFCALNITFENSAGPVGQAVAIRITGDKAIFYNCNFLGRQDTWYGIRSRHFIRKCYIEGTTDFMFGGSTTWFDSCTIHSYGGTALTAASTDPFVPFGYVFRDCKITGESGVSTSLGRPWRPYSAVSYQYCSMSSCITPSGWDNWGDAANEKTARYSEYKNTGSGANTGSRVTWAKRLTDDEFSKYTIENVLKATYADPPVVDNWSPLVTLERYTSPATGSIHQKKNNTMAIKQSPIRMYATNGIVFASGVVNDNVPITMSIITIDGRVIYRTRFSSFDKKTLTVNGLLSGIYIAVTEKKGYRWTERIILD